MTKKSLPPPEKIAETLLQRFLDESWPKTAVSVAGAANWLESTGSLPRFPAPTLFLGLEGQQRLEAQDATLELSPGAAILVHAGLPTREFSFGGEGSWLGMRLDSRPFTIYGQFLSRHPFAAAMTEVEGWPHFRQIRRAYELLTQPDVRGQEDGNRELIRVLIHYVLQALDEYPWRGGKLPGTDLELSSPKVVGESGLQLGALFIDRQLKRPEIASGIGISESYLATVFQGHLGTNFTEYLLLRRMTHADGLLLGGKVPIGEIAKLCGFSTSNYFIRAFKRLRQTTPLQIRKLARNKALNRAEAAQMFHYEGFQRLAPISEDEAQAISHGMQPHASRALMVANSTSQPVCYDWQHAPGEYFEYSTVPPLNVRLFWHPAPAVWRIRSAGQIIGHYATERSANQILV